MDEGLLASGIKHRFQEAAKGPLILFGDMAILLNDLGFSCAQTGFDSSLAEQNISHINAKLGDT